MSKGAMRDEDGSAMGTHLIGSTEPGPERNDGKRNGIDRSAAYALDLLEQRQSLHDHARPRVEGF